MVRKIRCPLGLPGPMPVTMTSPVPFANSITTKVFLCLPFFYEGLGGMVVTIEGTPEVGAHVPHAPGAGPSAGMPIQSGILNPGV